LKLSGEQFQEIISQLVSDDQDTQQDKRREPRVGIHAQGVVTPWTLDEDAARQTPITIRDLSRGGICILSPAPMPKGARFVLRLLRMQQTMLLAHYEVRYSKTLTKTLYSIGAKLVNLSDSLADTPAA
jgi:c-di-GMP-binding flagellar brake protein YcgR